MLLCLGTSECLSERFFVRSSPDQQHSLRQTSSKHLYQIEDIKTIGQRRMQPQCRCFFTSVLIHVYVMYITLIIITLFKRIHAPCYYSAHTYM